MKVIDSPPGELDQSSRKMEEGGIKTGWDKSILRKGRKAFLLIQAKRRNDIAGVRQSRGDSEPSRKKGERPPKKKKRENVEKGLHRQKGMRGRWVRKRPYRTSKKRE